MLVKRIRIINHQQFGDLDIKLTYPEGHEKAGKPLEKVCFIGRNGTGKTTLLRYLKEFYNNLFDFGTTNNLRFNLERGLIAFYIDIEESSYVVFYAFQKNLSSALLESEFDAFLESCGSEKIKFASANSTTIYELQKTNESFKFIGGDEYFRVIGKLKSSNFKSFLDNRIIIYSPLDGTHYLDTSIERIEDIDIDQALNSYNKLPIYHDVSFKNLESVFKFITYEMQRRIEKQDEFEKDPFNIKKSKEELLKEFDKIYPDIIKELSNKWNVILESEGLEFDISKASKPTQFINSINNFIKSKVNDESIETLKLSSGTLSIILRLGYLTTLYNNRQINLGIALFDEPENSLFPDVLYNIVDTYISVTHNTQFFFATHSPIVAAQFEPCERVILDFDEKHKVYAKQGIAPLGDDPNDLLRQDFGRKDLMNEKGLEMWERYKAVKDLLKNASSEKEKIKLLNEFMELQKTYHFPAI